MIAAYPMRGAKTKVPQYGIRVTIMVERPDDYGAAATMETSFAAMKEAATPAEATLLAAFETPDSITAMLKRKPD